MRALSQLGEWTASHRARAAPGRHRWALVDHARPGLGTLAEPPSPTRAMPTGRG